MDFLRVIILRFFYLQKKLKLLKKDIRLDVNRIGWTLLQIRSDRSRIRIIFIGLFFIGFESDNFASNRIGFASNSDYITIPTYMCEVLCNAALSCVDLI